MLPLETINNLTKHQRFATCSSGRGRLLDYFVDSEKVGALLGDEGLADDAPFGTHQVVLASMSARPRQSKAQVVRRPAPLPPAIRPPWP